MRVKQLLLTVIGFAFIFQNIVPQAVNAEEMKMRIGHVLDAKHAYQKTFIQFAEDVERDTNGMVKINVVPSSGLGSLDDMVDQLKMGALEMMSLFPVQLARMDKKFLVDQFPYLWKDLDSAMIAMHGDLGEILDKLSLKQGIKILAYLPIGFRQMTNNVRPIYTPNDLKGLKMRIPSSRLQTQTFRLFGVSPAPIVFGELYSALQLGTVDGQENPLATIYTSRFYEVQKYLSLTNHSLTMGTLSYSRNLWEKLPKDLQNVLKKNALKAEDMNLRLLKEADNNTIDLLKAEGMEVNEADIASFKKALKPIYTEYKTVFGPEMVAAIEKYTNTEF